jgi:serine phosphatase RsbU (regulator of sigma subunit)
LIRDGSGVAELASTGLPLGLFSHATCEAPTLGLAKGSAVALVSRGVIECEGRGSSSAAFGLDRVKTFLQGTSIQDPKELCGSILTSVSEFTGNAPICDDRTALALLRAA